MANVLSEMMKRKGANDPRQMEMAAREVMQEIILAALSNTDFYSKAGFYGGTALRVFHGINRFSEDLDFSLLAEDPSFHWEKYFPEIERQFAYHGLKVEAIEREKVSDTDTRSAFLKENTIETMKILLPEGTLIPPMNHNAAIRVKFEVDVQPPKGATYEWMNLSNPFFARIRVLDLPSLFAGKIAAILLRTWKNRVKGRDYYDYLYYIGTGTQINFAFLEANLRKGNKIGKDPLNIDLLKEMLTKRFEEVDFDQAASEVRNFLKNPEEVEDWDKQFFLSTLQRLKAR